MGLAFKAGIDDFRESPALQIVEELFGENIGRIIAVESNIDMLPSNLVDKGIEQVSLDAVFEKANIIVVLVDHKEFKTADSRHFIVKVVIGTRGLAF